MIRNKIHKDLRNTLNSEIWEYGSLMYGKSSVCRILIISILNSDPENFGLKLHGKGYSRRTLNPNKDTET